MRPFEGVSDVMAKLPGMPKEVAKFLAGGSTEVAAPRKGPLKVGDELFRGNSSAHLEFSFEIAIYEKGLIEGADLIRLIDHLGKSTERIVNSFAPLF